MTVVVGYESDGVVGMVADTCLTSDDYLEVCFDKIVTIKPANKNSCQGFLLGTCGEVRTTQQIARGLAKLNFKWADGEGFEQWVYSEMLEFLEPYKRKEPLCADDGWKIMVGAHGVLIQIDDDLCTHRSPRGWSCIGSGATPAAGVMMTGKPSRNLALKAVKISAQLTEGVRGTPLHFFEPNYLGKKALKK